ncbi:hypothetical protein Hanom_Chr00s022992g01762231 [Helianthus anomalus]
MHNYVFTSCSLFFQNSILRMITFSKLGNLLHMLNISYHFLTPWFFTHPFYYFLSTTRFDTLVQLYA